MNAQDLRRLHTAYREAVEASRNPESDEAAKAENEISRRMDRGPRA